MPNDRVSRRERVAMVDGCQLPFAILPLGRKYVLGLPIRVPDNRVEHDDASALGP
jgi:hypothetical protein